MCERSTAIRAELKKLGYTSKQISVTSKGCGYSTSINVRVKDLTIDIESVKKVAEKQESIRYDEYNGEILQGGNTYIHVSFDWEVVQESAKEKILVATRIFEENKGMDIGSGKIIEDNNLYKVVYYPKPHFGTPEICLTKKSSQYIGSERYYAAGIQSISETLVYIENITYNMKRNADLNAIFANDEMGILKTV